MKIEEEGTNNITVKVLRRKPNYLLCPYCTQNIPSITFKTSNGHISLNCICTLESKDLLLPEFMANLQKAFPLHSVCLQHKPNQQEKYCMDCGKWLCNECLRIHAYTTSNHSCIIDYHIPIRCNEHCQCFSHYCKQCYLNICALCKSNHFGHALIELKPVHITPYQNQNEELRRMLQANKEKTNQFVFRIDYQINKLNNEILALSKMKQDIKDCVRENEEMINNMIDYIECLCNTSLALGTYNCYSMMNNFSALAIPNNYSLNDDTNDKDKEKDNKDNDDIEEANHQLKAMLMNPFVVRFQSKATFKGHTAYVDQLIQSNENGILVSSSGDKTLKFWNAQTLKCEATTEAHHGFIYQLIRLSDGQLASRSNENTIKLWSTTQFKCNGLLEGHTNYIHHITELSMSDRQLVSSSADNSIKLWNTTTLQCIGTLNGHTSQVREVLEVNRGIIVSRSDDKTIRFWNIESLNCNGVMENSNSFIREIVIIFSHNLIAFRSDDADIHLWNASSLQKEKDLTGHTDMIEQLLLLSDGQLASLAKDNKIKLWNINESKCNGTLKAHSAYIRRMLQLSDGQLLSYSDDMTIKLWNATTMMCNAVLRGHTGAINHISILNIDQIASCGEDNAIRLWTITRKSARKGQQKTLALIENRVKDLSSSDGVSHSLIEDREDVIKSNATLIGHTGIIYNVIQLRNGELASCSSDTTIKLWHI